MSFIELQDFMIYQLVNKKTEILPLAIGHLSNQFNHGCALLIFIKLGLKLSYFRAMIALPPNFQTPCCRFVAANLSLVICLPS